MSGGTLVLQRDYTSYFCNNLITMDLFRVYEDITFYPTALHIEYMVTPSFEHPYVNIMAIDVQLANKYFVIHYGLHLNVMNKSVDLQHMCLGE